MRLQGRPGVVPALLVAVVVAGCAVTDRSVPPTPEPIAEEHMPLYAAVDVVGAPPVADRDIDLDLINLPDGDTIRTSTIRRGTVVHWHEVVAEGPIRLLGDDRRCTLDVDLPPERTTYVELHHEATTCGFVVVEDGLPLDSGRVSLVVNAQPWNELAVDVASLDGSVMPVPGGVSIDQRGLAEISPLYPGRYELRLRHGDRLLERREVTIEARDEGHEVSLVLDGVPD